MPARDDDASSRLSAVASLRYLSSLFRLCRRRRRRRRDRRRGEWLIVMIKDVRGRLSAISADARKTAGFEAIAVRPLAAYSRAILAADRRQRCVST